VTEDQYLELIARLERIEAKQLKERWDWHFTVMLGIACLVAVVSPQGALVLMATYLFIKAYRWNLESIPPQSSELMLMQVGEDGEPDRPTPISSLDRGAE
jgi:hypothetical protein